MEYNGMLPAVDEILWNLDTASNHPLPSAQPGKGLPPQQIDETIEIRFLCFMMEFLMRCFFQFMVWAVGFLFGILPTLPFT